MAMNLAKNNTEELNRAKQEYDDFLGNLDHLNAVLELLKDPSVTDLQKRTLLNMEKSFRCYIVADGEARGIREQTSKVRSFAFLVLYYWKS